jgi:hypothetical protein
MEITWEPKCHFAMAITVRSLLPDSLLFVKNRVDRDK